MCNAEPALASSVGAEPAVAAAGQDTGRESKAPAAHDSPGRPSVQAASGAAGGDAAEKPSGWAEAARPDSLPGEPGAQTAAGSAGDAPNELCSITAAGTAAAGNSTGQLPSRKAGRQPAAVGSSHREASSNGLPTRAGKQQAAHDGQKADVAQVCCCNPPTLSLQGLCHPSGCGQLSELHAAWQAHKMSAILCAQALPSLNVAGQPEPSLTIHFMAAV